MNLISDIIISMKNTFAKTNFFGASSKPLISDDALKIFACITMLIDHLAMGLFAYLMHDGHFIPGLLAAENIQVYHVLRHIGRTAFPIFCFLLVQGFFYTHSKKKYCLNLFLFALISEFFYDFALLSDKDYHSLSPLTLWTANKEIYLDDQNVYFTLLLGFICVCACDFFRKKYLNTESSLIAKVLTLLLCALITLTCCLCAVFLKTDYSYKGIILIMIFYIFSSNRPLQLLVGYIFISLANPAEAYAIFGFGLLSLSNGHRSQMAHKAKYAYYSFYPVHLCLIFLLRVFLLRN